MTTTVTYSCSRPRRVAYEVAGCGVQGVFTVGTAVRESDRELLPQRVRVDYGDTVSDTRLDTFKYRVLPNAPAVNGVTVIGTDSYLPEQIESDEIRTAGYREHNDYSVRPLPARSQAKLTAVVRALVRHWLSRDDLGELREAAAACTASLRAAVQLREAWNLEEMIADLGVKRDAAKTSAEQLLALAVERKSRLDESRRCPDAQNACGPVTPYVVGLIERAEALSIEQVQAVEQAIAETQEQQDTAMREAMRAALESHRDEAWRYTSKTVCRTAACALIVRDLLDRRHYEVLIGPWADLLGPLHPDDIGAQAHQ